MKTIIAGSRYAKLSMNELIDTIYQAGWPVTEVVSGHSGNVDLMGEKWAKGLNLPVTLFPADWNKYGKGAGPIRNRRMAEYAEGLIFVWDGKSNGTKNMILEARNHQLPVWGKTL